LIPFKASYIPDLILVPPPAAREFMAAVIFSLLSFEDLVKGKNLLAEFAN
jgi:hypothetical protein